MTNTLNVRYVGMLKSEASWAKVGRELTLALRRRGLPVAVTELIEDRYNPQFELSPLLEEAIALGAQQSLRDNELTFSFSDPLGFENMPYGPPDLGLVVYEATHWPPQWVEAIDKWTRRAIVTSQFAAKTLADSGFPADRIGIVAHGVDTAIFHPQTSRRSRLDEPFTILFVGTTAKRKSLDVLLRIFQRAFSPQDDVRLVLKVVPYADEASRSYLYQGWRDDVARCTAAGYSVEVIEPVFNDVQMADLYNNADVLCLPFRGECYPLPFLEALGCGLPIVTTAWAGAPDLLDDSCSILVPPAKFIEAEAFLPAHADMDPRAQLVEPDEDVFVEALRSLYGDRDRVRSMGESAAALGAQQSWDNVVSSLISEFEAL